MKISYSPVMHGLFILLWWPFLASGDSSLEPCTVVQEAFGLTEATPACLLQVAFQPRSYWLRERGWPSEGTLQVVAKCIFYPVVQSLYKVTSKPSIVMMQLLMRLARQKREKMIDLKRTRTNQQEKAMSSRRLTIAKAFLLTAVS